MSVVSLPVTARLVQGVSLPHHLRIASGSFAVTGTGSLLRRLVAQHFTRWCHKNVSSTDVTEWE
jgi:hypothetical protein